MTDKALILGRDDVLDDTTALPGGVRVQLQRDDGFLVTGSSRALEELATGPGRVKLLRDTNLIRLYGNVVDIEADDVLADVSTRRRVPATSVSGSSIRRGSNPSSQRRGRRHRTPAATTSA